MVLRTRFLCSTASQRVLRILTLTLHLCLSGCVQLVWVLTCGAAGSLDKSIATAGQRNEAGEEMASPVSSLIQPEVYHPEQSPRSPRLAAEQLAGKTDDQLLTDYAAKGDTDVDISTLSTEQRQELASELRQFEAMAASLEARSSVNQ